jgi:sialate O-acetylesterase
MIIDSTNTKLGKTEAVPHSKLPKSLWHDLRKSFYWRLKVKTSLTVASVFTHHAVLQRDMPVAIWGTTDPKEFVEVSFGEQTLSTRADSKGNWTLSLAPMAANAVGQKLYIKTFFKMITLHYVVVGEVWVCSGQSNMGWTIDLSSDKEKHLAEANNPLIRMLPIPSDRASEPQTALPPCKWAESHPDHTQHWSAVGYHFAQELYAELQVPIGIIWSALGATKIQEWTSQEVNHQHAYEIPEEWNDNEPSSLFNSMIAPLIPYAIRGVAWYQGEENHWGAGLYQTQQSAMIEDWRERWGQGSFPFIYVQLANFGKTHVEPWSAWAELQEAQLKSLSHPNTAMAVAIDVGEADDIHPRRKQPVGQRLGIAALGKFYKRREIYSGPLYCDFKVEGDKIRIFFDHVGKGLQTSDGQALKWFEIAELNPIPGKNAKFVPATAVIDGDTIVVSNPNISKPIATRYAFNANPEGCNLCNSEFLPASPFRTSLDWSATLGNNPKRPIQQLPVALHQRLSVAANNSLAVTLGTQWAKNKTPENAVYEILEKPKFGTLTGTPPHLSYQARKPGLDKIVFRVKFDSLPSNIASILIDITDNARENTGSSYYNPIPTNNP